MSRQVFDDRRSVLLCADGEHPNPLITAAKGPKRIRQGTGGAGVVGTVQDNGNPLS